MYGNKGIDREYREYLDRFRSVELLAECSTRELRAIASMSTPITVQPGRVLMRQCDIGVECFIVLTGHAIVERNGRMIGQIVAGSLMGEISVMRHCNRTATVTAATEMELLVLTASELASLRAMRIGAALWEAADELAGARLDAMCERDEPVEETAPQEGVTTH
jgi:CRP-like cAMP-binding protein